MFRRMSWCGHHTDLECAYINNTLLRERVMLESQLRRRAGADHRPGLIRDLAAAGDKVRVQVGIEDMCQLNPTLGSGVQVSVHITKRVYQYPFFCVVRSGENRQSCQVLYQQRVQ